ncbi:MAG: hypothetical protein Q4E33_03205 [Erysipelotrichaceae bacterium]|nr:hypothetical protein [Erysipelotrichaceae bacterium]
MKKMRKILFISGLVIILAAICVLCFIFGRGHTVYLDNKTTDNTKAYEYIEVYYQGEEVTTLAKNERTVVSVIGQKLELDLVVTEKRNSSDEDVHIEIELPYDMDNIVVSLNGYLAGEDEYISEFVSLLETNTDDAADEEINTGDEFNIEGLEG